MPVEIQNFEFTAVPDDDPVSQPAPAAPPAPAGGAAEQWHRAHAVRRNRLRAD
jgi:hypothetical protein